MIMDALFHSKCFFFSLFIKTRKVQQNCQRVRLDVPLILVWVTEFTFQ